MEIIKKISSQKIILFTLLLIINSCGVYVQFDYDSDVNFNNLPTSDPGVAGRLYQTGSDAIGATAGFQVVCISQG